MVWAFETEPEFRRKLDWAEEFVRRGGRASIAQIDVVLGRIADRIMAESIRPGAVKIDGNSSDGDVPRGLSCVGDDNSCVVDVRNDAQFRGLAEAMDKPAWLACEDFRAPEGRLAHRGVIEEGLRSWTRRRSPRDVMPQLQQHGAPAGFMQRATESHEDPHLIARGFLRPQEQPQFPDPLVTQDGEAAFSNIGRPLCGPAPAAQRRKW